MDGILSMPFSEKYFMISFRDSFRNFSNFFFQNFHFETCLRIPSGILRKIPSKMSTEIHVFLHTRIHQGILSEFFSGISPGIYIKITKKSSRYVFMGFPEIPPKMFSKDSISGNFLHKDSEIRSEIPLRFSFRNHTFFQKLFAK